MASSAELRRQIEGMAIAARGRRAGLDGRLDGFARAHAALWRNGRARPPWRTRPRNSPGLPVLPCDAGLPPAADRASASRRSKALRLPRDGGPLPGAGPRVDRRLHAGEPRAPGRHRDAGPGIGTRSLRRRGVHAPSAAFTRSKASPASSSSGTSRNWPTKSRRSSTAPGTRELAITPSSIDVILQAADHLRRWLAHLEKDLAHQPSEPPARDAGLAAPESAPSAPSLRSATGPGPRRWPPGRPPVENSQKPAAAPRQPAPASQRGPGPWPSKWTPASSTTWSIWRARMVIAESLVRHDDRPVLKSPMLQRKISHLTRITPELQKTAMAMRLVPVGPLFRRMARLVRDLSRQFGKTGRDGDAGRRHRARPDDCRGIGRPVDAHGAERPGPRHRIACRKEAGGKRAKARLSSGRITRPARW